MRIVAVLSLLVVGIFFTWFGFSERNKIKVGIVNKKYINEVRIFIAIGLSFNTLGILAYCI